MINSNHIKDLSERIALEYSEYVTPLDKIIEDEGLSVFSPPAFPCSRTSVSSGNTSARLFALRGSHPRAVSGALRTPGHDDPAGFPQHERGGAFMRWRADDEARQDRRPRQARRPDPPLWPQRS